MNWTKPFIKSAGVILLAAALVRLLIAASDTPALSLPEPMLGIPIRYAVLAVGVFELIVALICLFGQRTGLQLAWLAWMATNYAVYWTGLWLSHIHPQATAIGSITDPLLLSRGASGYITMWAPVYLMLGSYAALGWLWLEGRKSKAARFWKMSCPSCGVHIRFDERNMGRQMPCPHCQTGITLRRPENLKMNCFFCKEHIEFPAHAIGEKIACPHCKMDITLKEIT